MLSNLVKLSGYILLAREAADFMASARDFREGELKKQKTGYAVSGTIAGLAAGVALGVLFAPRSGKETRELISSTTGEIFDSLQDEFTERKKQLDDAISRKKEQFCSDSEKTAEEGTG